MKLFECTKVLKDEKDRDKVAEIYKGYSKTMLYAANYILKEIHLAEDAVSEAFIKIIDNLEKIDQVDSYRTRAFIMIIVRNTAIDMFRKQKKNQTVSLNECNYDLGYEESAFDQFSVREACEKIGKGIAKLSKNYSDILYLKIEMDCSYEEMGKILGISRENAKMRLYRARKALKEELRKEREDEKKQSLY